MFKLSLHDGFRSYKTFCYFFQIYTEMGKLAYQYSEEVKYIMSTGQEVKLCKFITTLTTIYEIFQMLIIKFKVV